MENLSEATERHLITLTLQGDADAFGALVVRYQSRVIRVAGRLLGDAQEAEDVAQEAFLGSIWR